VGESSVEAALEPFELVPVHPGRDLTLLERDLERLGHLPGVAKTNGVDATSGSYRRERVSGESLQSWAPGRSSDDVIALGLELLAALGAIHERGLFLGGLSLDSLLVRDGKPLVLDLARLSEEPARLERGASRAPEALAGARADRRADIHDAGLVIAELLVRTGTSDGALTAGLQGALARLTAPDPNGRAASAAAAAAVLARASGRDEGSPGDGQTAVPARAGALVGRTSRLDEVLETLRGGLESPPVRTAPGIVLVNGGPGIGRTRFLEEALGHLAARGVQIVRASGARAGQRPLGLFIEALRELGRGERKPSERALATLARIGVIETDRPRSFAPEPENPDEAQEARLQLADAIAQALFEAVPDRPLVIAIEDLDRADAGSRFVVRHLARRLAAARHWMRDARNPGESDEGSAENEVAPRCMLVATVGARAAEPGPAADEGAATASSEEIASGAFALDVLAIASDPWALEVKLEPLDDDSLATIASSSTGEPPSSPRTRELVRAAHGNPGVLLESVRRGGAGAAGSEPASIEAAIRARIENLPPRERSLLVALAAIGRECDAPLALEVAGVAPASRERPDAGLAQLAREFLARRGPGGYSLRPLLYDLLADEARACSAALGRALGARAARGEKGAALAAAEWALGAQDHELLERTAPAAIAHLETLRADRRAARLALAHANGALARGDAVEGTIRLLHAATAFFRAGSPGHAQEVLLRATRQLGSRTSAPETQPQASPEVKARAWRQLGVVRAALGAVDTARAAFRRARAALARRDGREAALERARIFLADAEASLLQGELDLTFERGEAGLRALRETRHAPLPESPVPAPVASRETESEPDDAPLSPATPAPVEAAETRARLLALLGHVALLRDRPKEAETLLKAALAIDERYGAEVSAARAHQRLGGVALARGDADAALAHWQKSLAIRERLGDRSGVAHLHANLSLAAARAGDLPRARALLRRSLRIREEMGDRRGRAASLHNLGYLAACQGELDDAVSALESCLALRDELGDRWYAAAARNNLGQVLLDLGRTRDAEEHLEAALATRTSFGDRPGEAASLANLSDLALRRGDFAVAIEREGQARRMREGMDSSEDAIDALRRGARLEIALGNTTVAIEAAQRAVKLARQSGLPLQEGPSRLLLGEALARAGKLDRAKRELERARGGAWRVGDRITARRTELELAAILVARGFPDDARAFLDSKPVPFRGARPGADAGATALEARGPLRVRERLLRARIELARPGGQATLARRFAEDALAAARSGEERELEWRALQAAAAAAEREGDELGALELGAAAQEIVEGLLAAVPEARREAYLRADPARAAALRGDSPLATLVSAAGTTAVLRPRIELRGSGLEDDAPTRPGATTRRRKKTARPQLPAPGPILPRETVAATSADLARADFAAILGLNRRIVDERDVNRLFPLLLEGVARLCGAERAFLAFFGERDEDLEVVAARGASAEELRGALHRSSRAIARKAAETGEAVLTADEIVEGPGAVGAGPRSILAAPVRSPDGRRGALYLDHGYEIGIFGARELKLVEAVADQCALALGRAALENAIAHHRGVAPGEAQRELLRAEARGVAKPTVEPARFHGLVGRSAPLRRAIARLDEAARTEKPVLIVGPRGIGKERAARALHAAGPRATLPFVVVDLRDAATAVDLEAALVGSDAVVGGALGAARGGTIVFKAIDAGPVLVQRALARIATAVLSRRGPDSPRLLATASGTESILAELAECFGAARVDLPSLADRREDVVVLVDDLLAGLARERGETKLLSPAAREALRARPLPGEVRELAAALVVAWARAGARPEILPDDLTALAPRGRRAPRSSV
jgi:tetratricopeptide (TPR) repeat protein